MCETCVMVHLRYGNQMGNMNRFGNMGMGQKFPRLGMNGHGQQWNQMQNNNPQNLQNLQKQDSGKSDEYSTSRIINCF